MDNRRNVKNQIDKRCSPAQAGFGIAVILLSAVGLTGLVNGTPEDAVGTAQRRAFDSLLAAWSGHAPALAQEPGHGMRARARCAECGFIESTSERKTLDEVVAATVTASASATPSNRRWITVRLADGSRHVIDDMQPAQWRPRQRVIVIGSAAAH